MSVKEKYIAALNDEQAKMVSYVKQMTMKVAFPEAAVTQDQRLGNLNNNLYKAC